MSVPSFVTRFLDDRGIRYSIDHHDACGTSQDLAEIEAVTGFEVAKSVVCLVDEAPVILVLPAPYHVSLTAVGEEFEASHVRLADPRDLAELFPDVNRDVAPPPLPLWKHVTLHIDAAMTMPKEIVFAAGSAEDAIRMRTVDWMKVAEASIGRFAEALQL